MSESHYSFYQNGKIVLSGSGVNMFPGTELARLLPGINSNSFEQVQDLLTARGFEIPEDLESQMSMYLKSMESNPIDTLPAGANLGYTPAVRDAMTDLIRVSNNHNRLVIGSDTFTISG